MSFLSLVLTLLRISDLQFNVQLQMKILGLMGTTTTKRALSDMTCPFELSAQGA
jgi:hypothetical protein